MHQLLRILNPAQRRRLFGRAQVFHYWLGGEWITAHPNEPSNIEKRDWNGDSLGWDWSRIERIGIINRALRCVGICTALESTNQAVQAEQLIERAMTRYGLTDEVDLVEFAARGLRTLAGFDEHPVVASAIAAAAALPEKVSLSDRFALVEDYVWDALRRPPTTTRC